ncbi:imelysin family protein [Limnobacter parvus]|uniref:Imelysin family protein n=1 Tax=Limnobacter parvus TaxID=2939690 RepID=A0ABT1XDZ9_9BURK|nr:imelysin family protein [Limnobacter parvus]MCR2745505.1 imelysin family protein [Limnobacter parvus]
MKPQHQHEFKNGLLRGLIWVAAAGVLLLLLNWFNEAKAFDRSTMLFPYYEPQEVLNSVVKQHYEKETSALLEQLQLLESSTSKFCGGDLALDTLKELYARTYLAWLELSAVVVGPMLDNNTVRQIDFRPVRANLLERAINQQPKGVQGMALVGSPAKGFPALEYLLLQPNFKPATAPCAYAMELVQDIARTTGALKWQPADKLTMSLYFNQQVGALHNLSWERMEKPMLKNKDAEARGEPASWPLSGLGLAQQSWLAHWHGIEPLLVLKSEVVPQANLNVVPLEAYLRGLGKIDLADELVKHSTAVNTALLLSRPASANSTERAVKAVKVLKGFMTQELAKELSVSIQFSSSDGD